MKKQLLLPAFILAFAVFPAPGKGAIDWAADILPGTVHANFAADNFYVTSPNGKETMSLISTLPNISIGAAIGFTEGYIDVKGGGGMLLNSKLGSTMLLAGAGLHLEVKPGIMIGPHAACLYFAGPEWWGDTDVNISDTGGFLVGLHLAAGDRIAYLLSLDYMSAKFDVSTDSPNVKISDPKLDMSGLAVQFGVRALF
jgi:hypothetical protein